jgi:hypothetical protein
MRLFPIYLLLLLLDTDAHVETRATPYHTYNTSSCSFSSYLLLLSLLLLCLWRVFIESRRGLKKDLGNLNAI